MTWQRCPKLKFPAPFFGGKAMIAPVVWQALGDPKMYIEPFCGSGVVLLNRPRTSQYKYEIINDADGHIANVWRALQSNPDEVAKWCDWPCDHANLMARKARLIKEGDSLLARLVANDTYYDPLLAGYWIWCASNWIGSGLTRPTQIPRLTNNQGINQQIPHLTDNRGINQKIPYSKEIDDTPKAVTDPYKPELYEWFRQLAERLRDVKVVCGDWTRVCSGKWQADSGLCGIYFDPPYGEKANREKELYQVDSQTVASDVAKWACERGKDKNYRIVLSGYFEEHEWLLKEGWNCHRWKAGGSYQQKSNNRNRFKEALFFSPHCNPIVMDMFHGENENT